MNKPNSNYLAEHWWYLFGGKGELIKQQSTVTSKIFLAGFLDFQMNGEKNLPDDNNYVKEKKKPTRQTLTVWKENMFKKGYTS